MRKLQSFDGYLQSAKLLAFIYDAKTIQNRCRFSRADSNFSVGDVTVNSYLVAMQKIRD